MTQLNSSVIFLCICSQTRGQMTSGSSRISSCLWHTEGFWLGHCGCLPDGLQFSKGLMLKLQEQWDCKTVCSSFSSHCLDCICCKCICQNMSPGQWRLKIEKYIPYPLGWRKRNSLGLILKSIESSHVVGSVHNFHTF